MIMWFFCLQFTYFLHASCTKFWCVVHFYPVWVFNFLIEFIGCQKSNNSLSRACTRALSPMTHLVLNWLPNHTAYNMIGHPSTCFVLVLFLFTAGCEPGRSASTSFIAVCSLTSFYYFRPFLVVRTWSNRRLFCLPALYYRDMSWRHSSNRKWHRSCMKKATWKTKFVLCITELFSVSE